MPTESDRVAATKLVIELSLHSSRCSMAELCDATGETMQIVRIALEQLVSSGVVIACAATQTYWIRRPGSLVVRAA
jgi:predicted transcriptional regulator